MTLLSVVGHHVPVSGCRIAHVFHRLSSIGRRDTPCSPRNAGCKMLWTPKTGATSATALQALDLRGGA